MVSILLWTMLGCVLLTFLLFWLADYLYSEWPVFLALFFALTGITALGFLLFKYSPQATKKTDTVCVQVSATQQRCDKVQRYTDGTVTTIPGKTFPLPTGR